LDINNWQHFRAPQSAQKKKEIENEMVIFKSDFLDKLTDDKPQGCWSIQSDVSKSNTTVRNLVWPGYFAYHKANNGLFGSVYIGEGLKNIDLAFLL
jgi:radial spoke head protein 9